MTLLLPWIHMPSSSVYSCVTSQYIQVMSDSVISVGMAGIYVQIQ